MPFYDLSHQIADEVLSGQAGGGPLAGDASGPPLATTVNTVKGGKTPQNSKVTALGSVAGTSAVPMSSHEEQLVTATLTADHVCTIAPAQNGIVHFALGQDATGGHTFSISDGTNVQVVPVATGASSATAVMIASFDGVTLTVLWARTLTPQRQQREFLGHPTTFRFRGNWAPSTVYPRGDVIVDPYGVLRWCGVAHTSGAAFSTGSEYKSHAPWWHQIATNGPFRGKFVAHAGVDGVQYTPGDIIVDPNTGQFTRALYLDSYNNGVWDATRFDDLGTVPVFAGIEPGVILPGQGMPDFKLVQGHGLFRKVSRLRYPKPKPLAVWHTSADFTSIAGSGVVTADIDPCDPNGNPALSLTTAGATYTTQLAAPVDISASIFRCIVKLSGDPAPNVLHQVGVLGQTLTTGATVNLPLDATGLWYGAGPNTYLVITDGGTHTDVFTVADFVSASAGTSVQQIPIVSKSPSFAYTAGTAIKMIDRGWIFHLAIQVSSDNFATTASEIILKDSSHSLRLPDAWWWTGGGPLHWLTVSGKSAANLAAVNSIRFFCQNITTTAPLPTLSVGRCEIIPMNGQPGSKGDGRAKCVFWGDDTPNSDWTSWVGAMITYGFPGTLATTGAIDTTSTTMSFQQLRHLTDLHGWQAAIHYYMAGDGGDDQSKNGLAKESYIMRARHALMGAGLAGNEDFAWHDDDHPTAANIPIVAKYFRAIRGYATSPTTNDVVQTLPPVNPYYVNSYGIGGNDESGTIGTTASALTVVGAPYIAVPLAAPLTVDVANLEQMTLGASGPTVICSAYTAAGATSIPIQSFTPAADIASGTAVVNPGSAMKAMAMLAIQVKGMIQFVYDPGVVAGEAVQQVNTMLFLDQNRANIDVVTFAEALQPWTVPA